MKEGNRKIPKKFSNMESSFMDRLNKGDSQGTFNRFTFFPKKLHFYSKDPGEDVVLVVRVHWIGYVKELLFILLFLLLPLLLTYISVLFNAFSSPVIYIGFFVVGILVAMNILITTIVKWYYSVVVVTDRRVVVVKLENAFYHSYSEARLEKIEDVTHSTISFWGNLFDVGNLDIDTAGHEIDFRLKTLPRPRELQDLINDLIDMKKKGKI